MTFKIALIFILTVSFSGLSAEPATSEKQAKAAVDFRESIFKLVKSNVGPLGAMAKNQMSFDAALVQKNAQRVNQLAAMIPDYFVIDTSGYELKTEAVADIWQNKTDFNDKASALLEASTAVLDAANSGDESATKKAIGSMFKTCKSCHDSYKAD